MCRKGTSLGPACLGFWNVRGVRDTGDLSCKKTAKDQSKCPSVSLIPGGSRESQNFVGPLQFDSFSQSSESSGYLSSIECLK